MSGICEPCRDSADAGHEVHECIDVRVEVDLPPMAYGSCCCQHKTPGRGSA